MHFWIDKRSQTCGYNGRRRGVPASLAPGRRRNKSLITPVHRLRAIENGTITQQLRRSCQQSVLQSRSANQQNSQCPTAAVLGSESSMRPVASRQATESELEPSVYLNAPLEDTLDTVPHAQLMRLGGLTKYGMWASFGLTTISVAATRFYVDHQSTFEILLLCTLGVLSAGLLVSCVISICKRNSPSHFLSVQLPSQPPPQQTTAVELDSPEVRDMIITPLTTNMMRQTATETRSPVEPEQPPPPYEIAILLPATKSPICSDYPPPSYENAIR